MHCALSASSPNNPVAGCDELGQELMGVSDHKMICKDLIQLSALKAYHFSLITSN